MRCSLWTLSASLILMSASPLLAQRGGQARLDDAASILVSRLELESYKATIKGLDTNHRWCTRSYSAVIPKSHLHLQRAILGGIDQRCKKSARTVFGRYVP